MPLLPTGPESDADLDRNASLYRAAVFRSKKRGLGPIALIVVTALVAVVVAIVLVVVGFALSQVQIGPQLISKGALAPAPTKAIAKAPPPTPPSPAVMPQGAEAFAK